MNTMSTYLMAPLVEASQSTKSSLFSTRKVLYGSSKNDDKSDPFDDTTGTCFSVFDNGPVLKCVITNHFLLMLAEEEDIVVPAEKSTLLAFMDEAMDESPFSIEIYLPAGSAHLPSKDFYELLYNRYGAITCEK